nr:RecName: Full=U6-ctenitoxin-Co1a; Short=U6-CNTX-Co1a; AltName: Full=Neurotoxin Oc F35-5 [Oligoctenus ornatus]
GCVGHRKSCEHDKKNGCCYFMTCNCWHPMGQ